MSTDIPDAMDRATSFRFNDHPTEPNTLERDINWITVEQRYGYTRADDDSWAIKFHSLCLGSDGEWELEPIPSDRDSEWLASHRFPRDVALAIAYRIEQDIGAGRPLIGTGVTDRLEVDRIVKAATLAVLAEVHA